jgi:IS1 family transposase
MGRLIVNVPVKDVECDEMWAFVGKKEKRVRPEDDPNYGDAYTFVAIERNTKLVLNFALGKRNMETTSIFIEGLRHATSGKQKFQITTDGFALTAPRSRQRYLIASAASRSSSRFIVRPRMGKRGIRLLKSLPWR